MTLGAGRQVIQEVFCWTRLPMEVRRLAARKEDLFRELLGDTVPAMPPGAAHLLALLQKHNVRSQPLCAYAAEAAPICIATKSCCRSVEAVTYGPFEASCVRLSGGSDC